MPSGPEAETASIIVGRSQVGNSIRSGETVRMDGELKEKVRRRGVHHPLRSASVGAEGGIAWVRRKRISAYIDF